MGETDGIYPVLVAVLAHYSCIYEILKVLKFLTFCLRTAFLFLLTALISWLYKWFFCFFLFWFSGESAFASVFKTVISVWGRKQISRPQPPSDILIFHLFRLRFGLCCPSETFLLILLLRCLFFFLVMIFNNMLLCVFLSLSRRHSHLEDNQISVVERGAFQDLRLLERL